MKKRSLAIVLAYGFLLVAGCASLQAQLKVAGRGLPQSANYPDPRQVSTNGEQTTAPAGLYTIFSNLGSGLKVYNMNDPLMVSGPSSLDGTEDAEQWIGVPFIPQTDAEVTEVEVAIGYVTGDRSLTITLAKDENGLPGSALYTWEVSHQSIDGGCCRMDVLKPKNSVKVSNATQYWITATTDEAQATAWSAWRFNYNVVSGVFAFQNLLTGGWTIATGYPMPAFGVFGTKE